MGDRADDAGLRIGPFGGGDAGGGAHRRIAAIGGNRQPGRDAATIVEMENGRFGPAVDRSHARGGHMNHARQLGEAPQQGPPDDAILDDEAEGWCAPLIAAGRPHPSRCHRRRGYPGSAAPRPPSPPKRRCRQAPAAIRTRLPNCGRRRRQPSSPRAPRHRRRRRPARRCRARLPRSCRPCRRPRSRRRQPDLMAAAAPSSWVHLPAGATPCPGLCDPFSDGTMPGARGGIHTACSRKRFPHHGTVIRVAVSMPVSDSFDATNGCMRIPQPLESFLFCPARPLRAAAAGHPAQSGW
jgi:hypothetical protein